VHAYLSNSEYARWAVLIVLETLLAIVLVWRRSYREFPAFCVYAAVLCVKSWLLLEISIWGSIEAYFYASWIWQTVAACLLLCVVIELMAKVCLPGTLTDYAYMRVLIPVCLAAALFSAWLPQQSIAPTRLASLNALIASEKAFGYVACATLGCLLVFTGIVGLSWTRHTLAIAAGIVLSTALSALIDDPAKYFPGTIRSVLSLLSSASFTVSVSIWVAAFLPTKKPAPVSPRLFAEVRDALRMAEALQRLLVRKPSYPQ
jgi:hypothetical protein